jgi:hypothetical protein
MEYMPGNLKVIFVCSSLEPGKDGVGDYCRRLAAELIKQGHQFALLSINDRYINEVTTSIQQLDNIDIPVMRVPAPGLAVKQNLAQAKTWVDEFNPHWLSLQFVTFGYHPKGLKVGLGRELPAISAGRQWQVMFHELWVGMAKEESAKLYWWGKVQKFLIRTLIKELQPAVIHTQTRLYQQLIAKMGYQAGYLPLFGNIPLQNVITSHSNDQITFLVFGTVHSGAPIHKLAKAASAYAQQHKKLITLTFIGHCGPEQDRWAKIWRAENLPVNILGSQPPEVISEMMFQATMGISATALAVVEKSGSFAAMREHGLPVMSLSKHWTPMGVAIPAIPQGIIPYQNNLEECLAFKVGVATDNSVAAVSAKFADALKNAKGIQ